MYDQIFDIVEVGYKQWRVPAYGLGFVVLGSFFLFGPDSLRNFPYFWLPARVIAVLNWSFFIFSILWTLLAFWSTYSDYRSARTAFDAGNYSVVEGTVTDFKPILPQRDGDETFAVGGKYFSYSDYSITAGYNQTHRLGGQIANGRKVRVTYIGNTILRLEIARQTP